MTWRAASMLAESRQQAASKPPESCGKAASKLSSHVT